MYIYTHLTNIFLFIYVYVRMSMCVGAWGTEGPEEGIGFPGGTVTWLWAFPGGDETLALWKRIKHSQPLRHLSSHLKIVVTPFMNLISLPASLLKRQWIPTWNPNFINKCIPKVYMSIISEPIFEQKNGKMVTDTKVHLTSIGLSAIMWVK